MQRRLLFGLLQLAWLSVSAAVAEEPCTERCVFVQVMPCETARCDSVPGFDSSTIAIEISGSLYRARPDGYLCTSYDGADDHGSVRVIAALDGYRANSVAVRLMSDCVVPTPIHLTRTTPQALAAPSAVQATPAPVPELRQTPAPSTTVPKVVVAPQWNSTDALSASTSKPGIPFWKVGMFGLAGVSATAVVVMLVLRESAAKDFNAMKDCGTANHEQHGGAACDALYSKVGGLELGMYVSGIAAGLLVSAALAIPNYPFDTSVGWQCGVHGPAFAACRVRF